MSDLDRLVNYVRRMAWIECAWNRVRNQAVFDRDVPTLLIKQAQRDRMHTHARRAYLTHA